MCQLNQYKSADYDVETVYSSPQSKIPLLIHVDFAFSLGCRRLKIAVGLLRVPSTFAVLMVEGMVW